MPCGALAIVRPETSRGSGKGVLFGSGAYGSGVRDSPSHCQLAETRGCATLPVASMYAQAKELIIIYQFNKPYPVSRCVYAPGHNLTPKRGAASGLANPKRQCALPLRAFLHAVRRAGPLAWVQDAILVPMLRSRGNVGHYTLHSSSDRAIDAYTDLRPPSADVRATIPPQRYAERP